MFKALTNSAKLIRSYSNTKIHSKAAYEILGLQTNAHPMEIKEAYLKLSKKFHPDVSSMTNSVEMFKNINEAYKILQNVAKDEEIFSSRINKKAIYNFEDTIEDMETFKKYVMKDGEQSTPTFSNLMSSAKKKMEKNRGADQDHLKYRMNRMFRA